MRHNPLKELLKKFHALRQGTKSVKEYYKEMRSIIQQAEIVEDSFVIDHFLDGLNDQIVRHLEVTNRMELYEVAHAAMDIEEKLERRRQRKLSLVAKRASREKHEQEIKESR